MANLNSKTSFTGDMPFTQSASAEKTNTQDGTWNIYAAISCLSQASFAFQLVLFVYEMSMQTNSMFCNANKSKLILYIPTLKVKA